MTSRVAVLLQTFRQWGAKFTVFVSALAYAGSVKHTLFLEHVA